MNTTTDSSRHDMTTTIDRHDCRTGGSYRYVMSLGTEEYCFCGRSTRSALPS